MADYIINVTEHGVTGNGVTDDAPALNTLFNSIYSAGAKTVYFPRGVYLLKSPVYLDGSEQNQPITGLRVFADPGTIIKAATPLQAGVWTASASAMFIFRPWMNPSFNVLIENFIFDGQSFGTTNHTAAGLYTPAIERLTVRNCIFQNIGDPGLGVSSDPRNDGIILGDNAPNFAVSMRAKDVLIQNCTFKTIVRNGISMLDVDGVVVDSCRFEDILNSCIDIEPNKDFQFARNITIMNSTFKHWEIAAVVAIPGEPLRGTNYPAQMETLKVVNCFMDGATPSGNNFGVLAHDWLAVHVAGNTIINVTNPAVYLRSCVGARVIANHISDCTGLSGSILVSQVDDVQPQDHVIQANVIKNSSGYAIRVIDLDTGSVVANVIRVYDSALQARRGIDFAASSSTCKNISVIANVVTDGGGTGGIDGAGHPIVMDSTSTRMLCIGNVTQDIGASASTDSAIDKNAASAIHAFNSDEQRVDFPFTSHSGMTPLSGGALGLSSAARKASYEITVVAGAAAGQVEVVSDFIKLIPVVNIVFSPINAAAAAMMLVAGGVFCSRTSTGFRLVHGGNVSVSDANFHILGVSS